MQRNDVKNAVISVFTPYAAVICLTQDGEIKFKRGFPAGLHQIGHLVQFMDQYDQLDFEDGCDVFVKPHRLERVAYGEGASDSGANPDFTVTSASRTAREMALLMEGLTAKSKAMDRRLAHAEALQRRADQRADQGLDTDVQLIDRDDETPSEEVSSGDPDPAVPAAKTKPKKEVKTND